MEGKKKYSKSDQKLIDDIEEYGLHIIHVIEDEVGPGFSYSVGLYHTYKHPEIIIVGLKQELSHIIINEISERIKKGESFNVRYFYSGLIDDFDCYFIDVYKSHYKDYVGYALWFYEPIDFPLIQCIYPTIKGIYPWQPEWPESLKNLQPILGETK